MLKPTPFYRGKMKGGSAFIIQGDYMQFGSFTVDFPTLALVYGCLDFFIKSRKEVGTDDFTKTPFVHFPLESE